MSRCEQTDDIDSTRPSAMTRALETMSEPRRAILRAIKHSGPLPIVELADRVGVTYEAVRQHLAQLELEGWLDRCVERRASGRGRPRSRWRLTSAGEHLFPKDYEELAVTLLDVAAETLGPESVRTLLAAVAEKKVASWLPAVEGKPIEARLTALQGIYKRDDPFCRVDFGAEGEARLVEMNCPFYDVAQRRPQLCSVTVSVLRRLLGREVVRVERFQEGHGRCVFKVLAEESRRDEPIFDWEPEAGAAGERDEAPAGPAKSRS